MSSNPFALLVDESEDLHDEVEVRAPVAKKIPATTTQQTAAKAQPPSIVGKTPVGKTAPVVKPVQKKPAGRQTQKEGDFEEKPEHKAPATEEEVEEGAVVAGAKKHHAKREYDHRSLNNVKHGENKKDTVGKGNWGNELDAQVELAEGGAVGDAAEEEVAEPAVPEPEESYKSLAEYQAEKEAAKVAAAAATNLRKANEGVKEDPKWKKMTVHAKEEEIFFGGKSKEQKERKLKEKPVKNVLVIEQVFSPPPREGGGRGGSRDGSFKPRGGASDRGTGDRPPRGGNSSGRGGSRGGAASGGRGGQSSGRGGSSFNGSRGRGGGGRGGFVNVNDTNAFPAL